MEANEEVPMLKNKFGEIKAGTRVKFIVENLDQWMGDLVGTLIFEEGEFKIQTKRSGKITINKGCDAYINTVEPID